MARRKYAEKPQAEDTPGRTQMGLFTPSVPKITEEQLREAVKVDPEAFQKIAERVWMPFLETIMLVDTNEALRTDEIGAKARERIYNRLFGKPVEQIRQDQTMTISIQVTPVTDRAELHALKAGVDYIEGEHRVLPDAEIISIPAPKLPEISDGQD